MSGRVIKRVDRPMRPVDWATRILALQFLTRLVLPGRVSRDADD